MQDGGILPAPAFQVKAAGAAAPEVDGLAADFSAPPVHEEEKEIAPREVRLTESQLEVFLSAQLGKEASCSFNESVSIHLRGELDEPALREALGRLLQRHEALRITFSCHGEFQRFAPQMPLDLAVVDLVALDAAARQESLDKLVAEDAQEASPGPRDSHYLFTRFVEMMRQAKDAAKRKIA